MKVKVSYTTDIKDVPSLVDDLLSSMRDNLNQSITKFRFNPADFEKMRRDLESARQKLSVVESQIDDVINITSGYLSALNPAHEDFVDAEDKGDGDGPAD